MNWQNHVISLYCLYAFTQGVIAARVIDVEDDREMLAITLIILAPMVSFIAVMWAMINLLKFLVYYKGPIHGKRKTR